MKRIAALAITIPVLLAQGERTPQRAVTAVRHWAGADSTRVAIEVTGDFKYRSDRLHNPERLYFDILDAYPRIAGRRSYTEMVDDKLLHKLRVAETLPGVTRVVLDLADSVEVSTSQLANPNRLMIELRRGAAPAIPTETSPVSVPKASPPLVQPKAPPVTKAEAAPRLPAPAIPTETSPVSVPKAFPPPLVQPKTPPVTKAEAATKLPAPPSAIRSDPPTAVQAKTPALVKNDAATPPVVTAEPSKSQMAPEPVAEKNAPEVARLSEPARPAKTPEPKPVEPSRTATSAAEAGKAARHTTTGDTSLVRALGLKLNRVVIDPGHGGHDQGTEGPHGLLEKELVLDVAQRLGKLIEDRMGAEVIYTRTDDTFIPLEGRTALANEKKADLFLSIHANSSPVPRITGVETFYLNFTSAKDALDVAARENASSQKSIFELRDIIQKITLHDKAEESREFASRLQSSLYSFSLRNFPAEKNRGIKKAPFVVLIGANMPSVLAEIGFLSNTREETLLKKSDYRQKLADALYRGISKYADSLSHFQLAQTQQGKP